MSLERFKYIEEYGNKYLISSWGNVYRNEIIDLEIPFGTEASRSYVPVKAEETKKGYLRVRLVSDGHKKWFKVHRLVAQAFIENPENKPQVNHIDGNKKNNSVTNLEWVTDEENKEHQRMLKRATQGE